MDEAKVIKVLLLSNQEIIVSEIVEVAAEFGDPNCKLTKPYKIVDGSLHKWMMDYTEQNEIMISSDKIITIIDPNKENLKKYIDATS